MTLDCDTGLFILLRLIFDIGRTDLLELNYDIARDTLLWFLSVIDVLYSGANPVVWLLPV